MIYRSPAEAGIDTGRGVAVEKNESQKLSTGSAVFCPARKTATRAPISSPLEYVKQSRGIGTADDCLGRPTIPPVTAAMATKRNLATTRSVRRRRVRDSIARDAVASGQLAWTRTVAVGLARLGSSPRRCLLGVCR